MDERLVRLSGVEYYLRQTARNMIDDIESEDKEISDEEKAQVAGCVFAMHTLADNLYRIPMADAVEVVRCKDCKRRGTSYDCPLRHLVHTGGQGYHCVDMTTDAGYCSFGERNEAGE